MFGLQAFFIKFRLFFVIMWLRLLQPQNLTGAQRVQRKKHIEQLVQYRKAGEFPHNTGDIWQPVFIDERQRHCTVAHMMLTSNAHNLAQQISAKHNLDYVQHFGVSGLAVWQQESGFTPDELAFIQMPYGPMDEFVTNVEQAIRTISMTVAFTSILFASVIHGVPFNKRATWLVRLSKSKAMNISLALFAIVGLGFVITLAVG